MKVTGRLQAAWKALAFGAVNYFEAGRSGGGDFRDGEGADRKARLRQPRNDRGSGDAVMMRAGDSLRVQARHLDENHDLARGILDVLVNRTVGRGIRYEPQIRDINGDLHDELNERLLDLHTRWSENPTVSGEYTRADMERLLARTWFRDGEVFKVYHMGTVRGLQHSVNSAPLSLEVFEPDYCPMGYSDPANGIVQGVYANRWGKPERYYFHKYHPGSAGGAGTFGEQGYKQVPAQQVNHLKFTRRLGQRRGESVFSAVLLRLDDLKDYEEAERIAARIASKLVGYVKRGGPDAYNPERPPNGEYAPEELENGTVIYEMLPGEDVGMFDNNKRPNPGLVGFRDGQLRAVSAGTMTSFSSASKNYNGTFSAQRQELVEQQEAYEVLQDYFITHSCKPDYRHFVSMALLGGLDIPPDVDRDTLFDVGCYGTAMPWVDPVKEAQAFRELLDAGLISPSEVIRRRGGNPSMVFKQIARDKTRMKDLGIEPKPLSPSTGGDESKQKKEGDEDDD